MKKPLLCGFIMSSMTTNAAAGGVTRPIYSTDILTYMDGIPIHRTANINTCKDKNNILYR
ncbi:MAG: hypothetical protein Q4G33_15190 [bacterium]|nr:hypothetical protein [bacterium]